MPQPRRQKGGYFPTDPVAPPPIIIHTHRRVHFSDVDAMAVVWHGRYAEMFEQANEELGQKCGLTYADFHRERLQAPIVQLHVDYFAPVMLSEKITVVGKMIWTEAARINIEYEIRRPDNTLAATGYTVQMFIDETKSPLLTIPALYETCRRRWAAGEFGGTP